jgi:hypothetical protein
MHITTDRKIKLRLGPVHCAARRGIFGLVAKPTMDDAEKLARLEALREEAAALEAELGIVPKTYGYSREEAAAAAGAWHPVKNPDEPQFYTLDDQAGVDS